MSSDRVVFPFRQWGERDSEMAEREEDVRDAERLRDNYRVKRWCRWAVEQPNADVRELGRAVMFTAERVGARLLVPIVEAVEGYDWPAIDGVETCDGRLS